MSIVAKAKADARVTGLLKEVESHFKISYHRSDDKCWGSNVTAGGVAEIHYQKTKHPGASLAHELLHLLVQHRGYRRVRGGISATLGHAVIENLIECFDNELQHHKMYPEFSRMGFLPDEFYADDDVGTAEHLQMALSSNPTSVLELVRDYFTLIAPGGCLKDTQRQGFQSEFLTLGQGRFAAQFQAIRSAMDGWATCGTYNAEPTLRQIFLTLENPSQVWLWYSTDGQPPQDGFFVDQAFGFDVAQGVVSWRFTPSAGWSRV